MGLYGWWTGSGWCWFPNIQWNFFIDELGNFFPNFVSFMGCVSNLGFDQPSYSVPTVELPCSAWMGCMSIRLPYLGCWYNNAGIRSQEYIRSKVIPILKLFFVQSSNESVFQLRAPKNSKLIKQISLHYG